MTEDTLNRYLKVAEMRDSGMSFRDIGSEIGVTRERVRQLYYKSKWLVKQMENMKSLSLDPYNMIDLKIYSRLRYALHRHRGEVTREDILSIQPSEFINLRGVGEKSATRLCEVRERLSNEGIVCTMN